MYELVSAFRPRRWGGGLIKSFAVSSQFCRLLANVDAENPDSEVREQEQQSVRLVSKMRLMCRILGELMKSGINDEARQRLEERYGRLPKHCRTLTMLAPDQE